MQRDCEILHLFILPGDRPRLILRKQLQLRSYCCKKGGPCAFLSRGNVTKMLRGL